jgi:hypothetical protein
MPENTQKEESMNPIYCQYTQLSGLYEFIFSPGGERFMAVTFIVQISLI